MTHNTFPAGGPRQPVYDYLRGLGFVESRWSDKVWTRADGIEVHIYGAGSMARIGEKEMPLSHLAEYLT